MSPSPTSVALHHEALRFSGHASFVELATSLLAGGMQAGDTCALLARDERIDSVRDAMGGDAVDVHFVDMSVAGRNPARVLPAMQHLVDSNPGRRMCWLAEPVGAHTSSALIAEAGIHEHLLRLPKYASWTGRLHCLYDPSELSDEAVSMLEERHRPVADGDAGTQLRRALSEPLPSPPTEAEVRPVDLTTLGALRQFVRDHAVAAGLGAERTDDLVYAVNEVVTNSICHGEGRARVSLWQDDGMAVCEVRDRGRIHDPLAGRIAPRPGQAHGRGLWLVNHLCDLVQLRSSEWGTVVRMYVDA